jgi:uncharacterized coiled-coil DUF342 family protein
MSKVEELAAEIAAVFKLVEETRLLVEVKHGELDHLNERVTELNYKLGDLWSDMQQEVEKMAGV